MNETINAYLANAVSKACESDSVRIIVKAAYIVACAMVLQVLLLGLLVFKSV